MARLYPSRVDRTPKKVPPIKVEAPVLNNWKKDLNQVEIARASTGRFVPLPAHPHLAPKDICKILMHECRGRVLPLRPSDHMDTVWVRESEVIASMEVIRGWYPDTLRAVYKMFESWS